jgi:hypothetical protein
MSNEDCMQKVKLLEDLFARIVIRPTKIGEVFGNTDLSCPLCKCKTQPKGQGGFKNSPLLVSLPSETK